MKIPMSFLVLLFLPSLLNAKSKIKTIYLPLVHINNTNFFDYKFLAPPLSSPHNGLVFMAEIFIGSPLVRQFLHIDTGSTLTWNQCYPCSLCFDHIYPKYWPESSTTYRDAKCETTDSDSNPKFDYSYSTGICTYKQQYADGSLIRGTLAKERIAAQTLDGRFVEVNDVYLGCNRQARGNLYVGTGILGLGAGDKYSLIDKIGSKFSFCFGLVREHDSTHNLILGNDANLEGHPTVIDIFEGQYIFQLESIVVGKEQVTFDNPLQALLDTGTSISHLSKGLYKNFVDRVSKLIGNKPDSYRPRPCYRMDSSKIPDNIDIGFIFAGGAELSVDAQSLFLSNGYPGVICLAIRENPTNFDKNIIGAIAMQGYNLGYNLDETTVYFQKRNCNLLKT